MNNNLYTGILGMLELCSIVFVAVATLIFKHSIDEKVEEVGIPAAMIIMAMYGISQYLIISLVSSVK